MRKWVASLCGSTLAAGFLLGTTTVPAHAYNDPSFESAGFFDEQGNKVDLAQGGQLVHAEYTVTNRESFGIAVDVQPNISVRGGCSLELVRPADSKVLVPATGSQYVRDSTYKVSENCKEGELVFSSPRYNWQAYNGQITVNGKPTYAPSSNAQPSNASGNDSKIMPPDPKQSRITAQPEAKTSPTTLPAWMIGILICAGILLAAGAGLYVLVQFEDFRKKR